jgi:hypothetical protein
MPVNATPEQRIAWHIEHKRNCNCRDTPEKLKVITKKMSVRPEFKLSKVKNVNSGTIKTKGICAV